MYSLNMYIFIKEEARSNAENQIIRFKFTADKQVIKIVALVTDPLSYYYAIFTSH